MKETTVSVCYLLCNLVEVGPEFWSEPDLLYAQQFILNCA